MADATSSDLMLQEPQPAEAQSNTQPPTTLSHKPFQQPSSIDDTGLSKRPRDARLIHMILANQGVTAYQERVPLQLLDFCYRYTSTTLQDALHLTSEFGQNVTGTGKLSSTSADFNAVSLQSLRLSIASRTHYQFSPSLPKEYLLELAQEKNRVTLPPVSTHWGLRLPPERYCLTGLGFTLKAEWDSEGDEEAAKDTAANDLNMDTSEEQDMGDGDERMEDVFGTSFDDSDKKDIDS